MHAVNRCLLIIFTGWKVERMIIIMFFFALVASFESKDGALIHQWWTHYVMTVTVDIIVHNATWRYNAMV